MSLWESFLTGATGLASMATGGLVPIYGEPEGTSQMGRLAVTGKAAKVTAAEVVKDPLKPLKTGAETVMYVATGTSLPWWAWAAAAAGGYVAWLKLKKRLV